MAALRRRSAGRLVPALFALAALASGAHAAGAVAHALATNGTRPWLLAVYGLLRTAIALAFAIFTLGRAAPLRPSRDPLAFLACATAMIAAISFAGPPAGTPAALVLTGEAIAVGFCAWLLVAVAYLGRCFGVLPEARGLVTRGPYRLIRHPVYLGELGACAGLVIASPRPANAALMAALIVAQSVRMRLEERALARAFPDYAAYAARTPRLLPRLPRPGARGGVEPLAS